MNFDWELGYLQKRILDSNDQIAFMHGYREVLENCPFEISINPVFGSNNIGITSLDQLHDARVFMRRLFGEWKDSLGNIWCSGDDALADWGSKEHPTWAIRLKTPREDFPKELMPSKTCGFVKVENDDYRLECALEVEDGE